MRKLRLLAVVSFMVVAASCSSTSEPMGVQITGPLGPPGGSVPIVGAAVDEGIVCDAATYEEGSYVDLDGKILTDEEFVQLMEVEMETGEWFFSEKHGRWTCTDGSGTFDTVDTFTMTRAEYDLNGANNAATWIIESGTDDYENLSGSGTVIVDFPNETVVYDGEMQK